MSYNVQITNYANQAAFPATGSNGHIYIADDECDKIYTWCAGDGSYHTVGGSVQGGPFIYIRLDTVVEKIDTSTMTSVASINIGGSYEYYPLVFDKPGNRFIRGQWTGNSIILMTADLSPMSTTTAFSTVSCPRANSDSKEMYYSESTNEIYIFGNDPGLNEVKVTRVNGTTGAKIADYTFTLANFNSSQAFDVFESPTHIYYPWKSGIVAFNKTTFALDYSYVFTSGQSFGGGCYYAGNVYIGKYDDGVAKLNEDLTGIVFSYISGRINNIKEVNNKFYLLDVNTNVFKEYDNSPALLNSVGLPVGEYWGHPIILSDRLFFTDGQTFLKEIIFDNPHTAGNQWYTGQTYTGGAIGDNPNSDKGCILA